MACLLLFQDRVREVHLAEMTRSMVAPIMSNFKMKHDQNMSPGTCLALTEPEERRQTRDRMETRDRVAEVEIHSSADLVIETLETCPIHSTETLLSHLPDQAQGRVHLILLC